MARGVCVRARHRAGGRDGPKIVPSCRTAVPVLRVKVGVRHGELALERRRPALLELPGEEEHVAVLKDKKKKKKKKKKKTKRTSRKEEEEEERRHLWIGWACDRNASRNQHGRHMYTK